MKSIHDLLGMIELRPAMYLGSKSLVRLKAFLDGWMFAKGPDANDASFLIGFQTWIQGRYGIQSSQSWAKIIDFFEADDVAAFEKALFLLNQYADLRRND